jgi:hypothetical protein
MGRRSLEATKLRCNFCARAAESLARDLPLVEADFFPDLLDDLPAVDFFFDVVLEVLLDFFELVCAPAGTTIPGASSDAISNEARKRLKELTAKSV